jgi:hypothetical protein
MSEGLDRRAFLGAATATLGAAAAVAMPLGARTLALSSGADGARSSVASPLAREVAQAGDVDGHIDDMWGHAPRYAHPIPHSPARTSPVAWEHVDPIDRMLVI